MSIYVKTNSQGTIDFEPVDEIYTFPIERLVVSDYLWNKTHENCHQSLKTGEKICLSFFSSRSNFMLYADKALIMPIFENFFDIRHSFTIRELDRVVEIAKEHNSVAILVQLIYCGFTWHKANGGLEFWRDLHGILTTLGQTCGTVQRHHETWYGRETAEAYLELVANFNDSDQLQMQLMGDNIHQLAWDTIMSRVAEKTLALSPTLS